MSNLFKQFKTDDAKERDGVAITYAANDDGTVPTFIVRRRGPGNQQYAKELQRLTEPYRRLIELGALDEMISRQIMLKVFCIAVLVGWTNVQDENGVKIDYSSANAVALLTALPELYDDLMAQSSKLALFRAEDAEPATKN